MSVPSIASNNKKHASGYCRSKTTGCLQVIACIMGFRDEPNFSLFVPFVATLWSFSTTFRGVWHSMKS
jgi:hypothetical protein